jgi:hypothetical protein
LIFGIKFRRAEPRPYSDAGALPYAHVPDGLAVLSDLPLQVRRSGAGHGLYHRMISSVGSSRFSSPVDRLSRMTIAV